MDNLYAQDAAEQLRRWDAGESVWSVEMGGLGPGYEQAIQILAIEITRDQLGKSLPDESNWSTWGDETVRRIDYGYSGAQVGAAKQLALKWLKDGPAKAYVSAPSDRMIQVSRWFPGVNRG